MCQTGKAFGESGDTGVDVRYLIVEPWTFELEM
jgi:hypothetical protein